MDDATDLQDIHFPYIVEMLEMILEPRLLKISVVYLYQFTMYQLELSELILAPLMLVERF